ncbi:MAG: FHA domain-containing protein, partial [Acidobacteriota bacterium]|nr:FHA domain-containing protein [Acidobacteriota bacterium]
MKIVLAIEKQAGQPASEVTFSQAKIRFGRDANNCEVFFDNREYRMVSRHHADIRFSNGNWMVGDMGSSFGTFLNGTRLQKPSKISVGSTIQFGEGGPRAHVIWLEGNGQQTPLDSPAEEVMQPAQAAEIPPASPATPIVRPQAPPASVPTPQKMFRPPKLKLEGPGQESQIEVNKDVFWIGRDPHCDFVIEESAVMVSRRHAKIETSEGSFLLRDNQSFNGTLINEQRISSSTPLYTGDKIRLGFGGPVLTFYVEGGLSRHSAEQVSKASAKAGLPASDYSGTMVFNIPTTAGKKSAAESPRQLLASIGFDGKRELTIGRDPESDITLDGLQISNNHARLKQTDAGVVVDDLNSTNGVYVNGGRISRRVVNPGDSVQIGSFVIETDEYGNISVFDTRSKTKIDAHGISKQVKDRSGSGMISLLDNISLSISPNEFVGLLGPSGAGKSTFMDALNGMRPPTSGKVYVNGLDLYGYLDSLKQSIGYVPQDEILYPGLKVSDTLYYIAKLRLSRDVSLSEIDQIIDEVLDVTGLTEKRDVPIEELSGGQRKRVSIAVELITKPSVIYLDEPTSGLDPTTEEKIMLLFRQIAESGRTVILTTHAMENVKLFDKIVLLMRGKLVFYGSPPDALAHFGAGSFKELFEKLEEPVQKEISNSVDDRRFEVSERVADGWRTRFEKTKQYEENVRRPLEALSGTEVAGTRSRHRLGLFGAIRQFATLSRRYLQVLIKDRFNLFILFIQAPVIAILVFFVMGANQPRDFVYFALSLCAIWFGTSVAAREIVRERKIYERERMVNLGILPYLASKYVVLGTIVALQCMLLFLPVKFFD